MSTGLDREWFFNQVAAQGLSLRRLSQAMGLDPSAVSRIVSGERVLKAGEQDTMARLLGVSIQDIAAHRLSDVAQTGFSEMQQAGLKQPAKVEQGKVKTPYRHPAWGAMKGMITLLPDVDLTEPVYEDWKKLYGEKDK